MKPVKQTTKSNCMQACVASMLEVDINQVPDFMENGQEGYTDAILKYANDSGWYLLDAEIDMEYIKEKFKDQYIIAYGEGPRGFQHAVICKNSEIVHDPHPSNEGIKKPIRKFTLFVKVFN